MAFPRCLAFPDNDAAVLPLTEDRKVDARSLHEWLGIGRRFPSWIAQIFTDYGFEAGVDYLPVSGLRSDGKAGRPRSDYLLTVDAAKEIAMIGNTARGRATRRYFIAAEKAAVKMAGGKAGIALSAPRVILQ